MNTTLPTSTSMAPTASMPWRPASIALMAGKGVAAYAFLQVLTGVEVGVFAAALVLLLDWSLPFALSVAIPLGFPLLLAQGALLFVLARSR